MKGQDADLETGSGAGQLTKWKKFRSVWAIVVTLTLAIMGGAQLPLGASYASTGVIVATVLTILTGLANAFTSDMLCWQAYYVGRLDYETLGHAIGGQWYQLVIEIFVFGLLFGTMITVTQQIGEVWSYGMMQFSGMPDILMNPKMLSVIGIALCLPFIFLTKLTALEQAGNVTFVIVIVSTLWLVVVAIMRGMPYLGVKGEFEWLGFTTVADIVGAISTFGFMFYIQPVMMPMLSEMPPGKEGVRLLSVGTQSTIMGTSLVTYWTCGFFAAAAFGSAAIETGNFLQNDLGGGIPQAVLNITFVLYLILSVPPFEYGTRHALDSFIMSWFDPDTKNKLGVWMREHYRTRQALLALTLYGSSLLLAVTLPGGSDAVITVTGAVGVGMVSYVIPIFNHFMLYFGKALCQRKPMFVVDKIKLRRASLTAANLDDNVLRNDSELAPSTSSVSETYRRKFVNTGLLRDSAAGPVESRVPSVEMTPLAQGEEAGVDTYVGTGPIPGGATDYSYIKKKGEGGLFVLMNEIVVPIIIASLGIFCAITTIVTM